MIVATPPASFPNSGTGPQQGDGALWLAVLATVVAGLGVLTTGLGFRARFLRTPRAER